MRSIGEEPFHHKGHAEKTRRSTTAERSQSWLTSAQAYGDRAARAGFVLSMLFLASAAVYATHLSGAADPASASIMAVVNQAAAGAGYRFADLAIAGASNTPRAALMEALELTPQRSSLFYDADEAQKRLMAIGWIEQAEVRRVLPSRLEITLRERRPFARVAGNGDSVQVIDRDGHILGPAYDPTFLSLPLFAGEGAAQEAAAFEDALSGHDTLKARFIRADYVAERFWDVRLDTGVLLKLPRKLNDVVLARLESLLASSKVVDMPLDAIDLRLPQRTVLQLKEPTVANRDRAIASLTGNAPPPAQPAPGRKGKAL